MTEQERKFLIALAAEAQSNPALAEAIPAATYRKIWLAIDEDMGMETQPDIVVDELLHSLGVRWIPE